MASSAASVTPSGITPPPGYTLEPTQGVPSADPTASPTPGLASGITAPQGYQVELDSPGLNIGHEQDNGGGSSSDIPGEGEQQEEQGMVTVPKEGESFSDTMQRAAKRGQNTTQDELNQSEEQLGPKAATALAVSGAPLAIFGGLEAGAAKALDGLPPGLVQKMGTSFVKFITTPQFKTIAVAIGSEKLFEKVLSVGWNKVKDTLTSLDEDTK